MFTNEVSPAYRRSWKDKLVYSLLFASGNNPPAAWLNGEADLRAFLNTREFRVALWLTDVVLYLDQRTVVGVTATSRWETGWTPFRAPLPPPASGPIGLSVAGWVARRLPFVRGRDDWLYWADGPRRGYGERPVQDPPAPIRDENAYELTNAHRIKLSTEPDKFGRSLMGYYAAWVFIRIEASFASGRGPRVLVRSTGVPSQYLYVGEMEDNQEVGWRQRRVYRMDRYDDATINGFVRAGKDVCNDAPTEERLSFPPLGSG